MKIVIINGSPRNNGTVSTLLKTIRRKISSEIETEFINLYDHSMKPCIACMKCRETGRCVLPEDHAHKTGERIRDADALIVGTPVHWGNMSAQLKILFDRNVPVLMGENRYGFPVPNQKGKPAVIVTACSTPWPFNFIAAESRGALNAVREVMHYSGYRIKGVIVKPGTRKNPEINRRLLKKAERTGRKISSILLRYNKTGIIE
ncbi:MAG TPA: flavodoxin family protein [Spirochaetota bacterium]|nr:flavodoxin family protein [Spirochaetota bacterium]